MFKIIYAILISLFLLSWYQIRQLPDNWDIDNRLLQEPIQSQSNERADFDFSYRGKSYEVKPIADYELWGLVVTQNNINAWFNIYHDSNSVNLKDICVVWGRNVANGSYKQPNLKFKSGEWTCYYRWNGELKKRFDDKSLSNNHLLTDSEELRKLIREVNIGDQVYFKGSLADYREAGENYWRQTSVSREDDNKSSRSGGACEIVFVDDFKIIKHHNYFWNFIYDWIKWIMMLTVICQLTLFIRRHSAK